jgi:uncharacterized protein with von Willebrand factor type A (vWA) domain
LSHRHFDGESQAGKGPMFLVRDESGSMMGDRHSLAVAVEWALIEAARKEKREFYSVPFSGRGDYHLWQAPQKGQPDPKGLLDHLSHFYGGGTDPYPPIESALGKIEKQDLKADILLITDEYFDSPSPKFMKKVNDIKSRIGIKIVVVQIGRDNGNSLPFADKTVNITKFLSDKEKLREAVAQVL